MHIFNHSDDDECRRGGATATPTATWLPVGFAHPILPRHCHCLGRRKMCEKVDVETAAMHNSSARKHLHKGMQVV